MGHDRNQRAKEEFAQRRMRKLTADAFNTGAVTAVDSHGNPIQPGALVVYIQTPQVILWQVADVKPDLRPGAPPGTMRMVLTCTLPIQINAALPVSNVLVVGAVDPPAEDGDPAADEKAADAAGQAEFDQDRTEDLAPPPPAGAIHLTDGE